MKAAVLTTRPLVPNNNGYTIRLYNILKVLNEKYSNLKKERGGGLEVSLISLCSKEELKKINIKEYEKICDKFYPIVINKKLLYLNTIKALFSKKPFKAEYYSSRSIKKQIKNIIKDDYDYIIGYHYLTSQYLNLFNKDKCWIELCDSISMLHERNAKNENNIFKRLFLLNERKRVLKIEKYCVENYKKVSLISQIDKNYLNNYFNADKISIIKNGVYIPDAYSKEYNKNEISFLGDMSYFQNHEAAKYFIKNIIPNLNSDIVFKIIGKNPKKELYKLASQYPDNVKITGYVDDVKKELLTSNFMVCPIKISAGLQNKVLEAMALGIPVITTSQVVKAICDNSDILIEANTKDEFIIKIGFLLNNQDARNQYSKKVRDYVVKNYNWNNVLADNYL